MLNQQSNSYKVIRWAAGLGLTLAMVVTAQAQEQANTPD